VAQPSRLRAILVRVAPLAAMIVTTTVVASGARSPTHLDPDLSWAAPSTSWPLGCGEAGVDLLALVAHATQRGVVLAAVVAMVGFVIGCPLGAVARRVACVRSRAGVPDVPPRARGALGGP
jgi:ABC-type dipeptide/oligopeptide/nickel transport system permease subunit